MKKIYSEPYIYVIDLAPDDIVVTSTTKNSARVDAQCTDDSEQLARERGGNPIWD